MFILRARQLLLVKGIFFSFFFLFFIFFFLGVGEIFLLETYSNLKKKKKRSPEDSFLKAFGDLWSLGMTDVQVIGQGTGIKNSFEKEK